MVLQTTIVIYTILTAYSIRYINVSTTLKRNFWIKTLKCSSIGQQVRFSTSGPAFAVGNASNLLEIKFRLPNQKSYIINVRLCKFQQEGDWSPFY